MTVSSHAAMVAVLRLIVEAVDHTQDSDDPQLRADDAWLLNDLNVFTIESIPMR